MRKLFERRMFLGLSALSLSIFAGAESFAYSEDQSPAAPGRLVDLGGYRLQLNATGRGGPAVVLIAGSGDFSFDWSLVQPGVSRFTRVCSYDRPGSGWSDLGPTPRTMKQEANELHLLLRKAGINGPYVLAGHSLGGLIARIYSDLYPKEVAGIVLVDSTHEDTTLFMNGKLTHMRELAKSVPIPPFHTMKSGPAKPPTEEDKRQAEQNAKMFGPPKIEPPYDKLPDEVQRLRLWALTHPKLSAGIDTFFAEELQAMYVAREKTPCPLGDKPLITIVGTANQGSPGDSDEMRRVFEEKRQQKTGFATLSRNGKVILAAKSGHHVQLDEPELVVGAIREVVEAVRHHLKLHP
jgi:pimeloyl-ACP methyl ester carboxylesterase